MTLLIIMDIFMALSPSFEEFQVLLMKKLG